MAAHDLLRSWLVPLLPIRQGNLRLVLEGVELTSSTEIHLQASVEQLDRFDCIERRATFDVELAHVEDAEFSERTRAYLRAWARNLPSELDQLAAWLASDDEPWWSTHPQGAVVFRALGPSRELLEDLTLETEEDFLRARLLAITHLLHEIYGDDFGEVEVPLPPLDWTDFSGIEPIARSVAHEIAIADAGYTDEAYDAYADWLAERNDPRGLFNHAMRPATQQARRRGELLRSTNQRFFFGYLDPRPVLEGGFIRELEVLSGLTPTLDRPLASMIAHGLRLPAACAVSRLRIALWYSSTSSPCTWLLRDWVRILEKAGPHATLRRIEVDTSYEGTIEVEHSAEEVTERTVYMPTGSRARDAALSAIDANAVKTLRALYPRLEEVSVDGHEQSLAALL